MPLQHLSSAPGLLPWLTSTATGFISAFDLIINDSTHYEATSEGQVPPEGPGGVLVDGQEGYFHTEEVFDAATGRLTTVMMDTYSFQFYGSPRTRSWAPVGGGRHRPMCQ